MRILVTGGTGLVGSAIQKLSEDYNYDFIFVSSKNCDLTDYTNTYNYFLKKKPRLCNSFSC